MGEKAGDWKKDAVEYNEALYSPAGWGDACGFVSMRIPKEAPFEGNTQLELLGDASYKYRALVTALSQPAHKVIEENDQRADCENLIGKAKQGGMGGHSFPEVREHLCLFPGREVGV